MSDSMTLTLVHVHSMHRVLWDVNVHAHHPLSRRCSCICALGRIPPFPNMCSQIPYIAQCLSLFLLPNCSREYLICLNDISNLRTCVWKNIFQLEGVTNLRKSCFNFLNRSIPFCSREKVILKPKEQKYIAVEAPFVEEISGMAIFKMLDK